MCVNLKIQKPTTRCLFILRTNQRIRMISFHTVFHEPYQTMYTPSTSSTVAFVLSSFTTIYIFFAVDQFLSHSATAVGKTQISQFSPTGQRFQDHRSSAVHKEQGNTTWGNQDKTGEHFAVFCSQKSPFHDAWNCHCSSFTFEEKKHPFPRPNIYMNQSGISTSLLWRSRL